MGVGRRTGSIALACLLAGCGRTLHVSTSLTPTETAVVLEPYPADWPTHQRQFGAALDLGLDSRITAVDDPEPLAGWRLRVDATSKYFSVLQRPWNTPFRLERDGERLLYWSLTNGDAEDQPTSDVDGLRVSHRLRVRDGVPVRFHLLHLPADQAHRLEVRAAGETIRFRRTVLEQAGDATAALNGGFFDLESGAPLGALKLDGEWIKPPLFDRTALLLPRDGPPRIAAVGWRGVVQTAAGPVPVDALNSTPRAGDQVAVTTPRWGGAERFAGFTALALDDDLIVHSRQPLVEPVRLELRAEPDCDGSILGGGPRLVRDGRVDLTAAAERFRPDITDSVCARTAVGIMPGGDLLIVYGERAEKESAGYSLEAWAELLAELGCRDAMAFDGATMATLVVRGEVIGNPQAGRPQPVATTLVVAAP